MAGRASRPVPRQLSTPGEPTMVGRASRPVPRQLSTPGEPPMVGRASRPVPVSFLPRRADHGRPGLPARPRQLPPPVS